MVKYPAHGILQFFDSDGKVMCQKYGCQDAEDNGYHSGDDLLSFSMVRRGILLSQHIGFPAKRWSPSRQFRWSDSLE
jgi:hypothetical protein